MNIVVLIVLAVFGQLCAAGPLPAIVLDDQEPSCSFGRPDSSPPSSRHSASRSFETSDPDTWIIHDQQMQYDEDCADHLFDGELTETMALRVLNDAVELLAGRRSDERPRRYDERASSLLRMMTGELITSPRVLPSRANHHKENSIDPDWTLDLEKRPGRLEARAISPNTAQIIIHMVNASKTLKSIKAKYPWYTTNQLPRIRKIAEGKSVEARVQQINRYTLNKIKNARANGKLVRGWMIQHWAMDRSRELDREGFKESNFVASHDWLEKFKKRHKIVSRKVTGRTSRHKEQNKAAIEASKIAFIDEFARKKHRFRSRLILNFDQSGFEYEMTSDRTLSFQGERDTQAYVDQENKVTHRYTIQPLTSRDGRTVGKLLMCMQETKNQFGPRVQHTVDELERKYKNVRVVASTSGKMSVALMRGWTEEVLLPAIQHEKAKLPPEDDDYEEHSSCEAMDVANPRPRRRPQTLILGDSWGGNTNEGVQDMLDSNRIDFMQIPAGTTADIQPQDVDFFRQWKYFLRRLTYILNFDDRTGDIISREGAINVQSLIWNQFSAPAYRDLIRYSWRHLDRDFSSGELTTRSRPHRIREINFNFIAGSRCEHEDCNNPAFMKCAHCGKLLCAAHFLERVCYHDNIPEDEEELELEDEGLIFDHEFDDDFDLDLRIGTPAPQI